MRLRFIDGYEFTAETKTGACEALWKSMKFRLHDSLDEWLKANAHTMENFCGVKLRTDSVDNQFDDMVAAKILTVISEN